MARLLMPSTTLALLVALPPTLIVMGLVPMSEVPALAGGVVAVAFHDANGDGRYDPGTERVLDGIDLRIDTDGPDVDPADSAKRTTEGYSAWWLHAERATIEATPPAGYQLTTPEALTVGLTAGRVATAWIGARPIDGALLAPSP